MRRRAGILSKRPPRDNRAVVLAAAVVCLILGGGELASGEWFGGAFLLAVGAICAVVVYLRRPRNWHRV